MEVSCTHDRLIYSAHPTLLCVSPNFHFIGAIPSEGARLWVPARQAFAHGAWSSTAWSGLGGRQWVLGSLIPGSSNWLEWHGSHLSGGETARTCAGGWEREAELSTDHHLVVSWIRWQRRMPADLNILRGSAGNIRLRSVSGWSFTPTSDRASTSASGEVSWGGLSSR